MNITHAEVEAYEGDGLTAIFNRQKELMEKYHDIESRSGLVQTEDCPVNLDDKRGQARIKDFSWRVVEELGEAMDAMDQNDFPHYCEELIDGLHFLTELTILTGTTENDLYNKDSSDKVSALSSMYLFNDMFPEVNGLSESYSTFIREIAMMCNCLKNKPWKQSQMKTDVGMFQKRLKNVWVAYLHILHLVMTPQEVVETYLKKSQVNKFRQRSNY